MLGAVPGSLRRICSADSAIGLSSNGRFASKNSPQIYHQDSALVLASVDEDIDESLDVRILRSITCDVELRSQMLAYQVSLHSPFIKLSTYKFFKSHCSLMRFLTSCAHLTSSVPCPRCRPS